MQNNSPPSREKGQGPKVTEVISTQSIPLRRQGQPQPAPIATAVPTPELKKTLQPLGQAPSIPSEDGKKTYAEENPEFTSIDLPSKFQFYSFKTLSVRTLKGSHQAKLNRAYTQNRLRYVVEAMGATLEPGVSAFDLTPGDFYFLMYWQRVNSFTKSPQIITTQCSDETHVARVQARELTPESLKIEQFLNSTTLDTKYSEPLDLPTLMASLPDFELGVETMRDVVDMTERMVDIAEDEESEDDITEYGWLASKAAFLRTPTSLAERCKVVGDMSVEDTTLLDKYMEAVTNYGVEEFATIKCKECGASKRVKISFDALTFLPGG
jgi:hypothetical protein